jgi:hypothetical protein
MLRYMNDTSAAQNAHPALGAHLLSSAKAQRDKAVGNTADSHGASLTPR